MKKEIITSAQNPKIKNLLLLQEKSKARREQGLFVVEGRRELEHCLEAGFGIKTIFFCKEILPEGLLFPEAKKKADASGNNSPSGQEILYIEIPEQLYRKVAYRDSTEGIIAEVEYKSLSLEDLQLPENPLIVVLEAVEKPGNLGAVLRSADAAGADAVFICDPLTDLYNPNLIRASIGAVFTVPTVAVSSEEAIGFLKGRGIQILTAQLQDSSLYYDVDMRRGTAIVMGTESTGLTPLWRQAADAHIRIPMLGRLDSLNVSVSASILLFEAVRQRQ
jgi:TrmH family RNA methyltransferase